ncbi:MULTISPECIES: DUF4231 domain-containing protein [unclassified Paraburkholderia]|uniref:DUF4231 domain-containing protein n=1 Tax=unclassified Paraburkholderia TaxID=2615204 RepID=UPI00161B7EED|nr:MULTISPECIES: DUF4231 domain-containing protein [unclassified Paraburkholderia]MBB5441805.1 hypothetical protein [Paraburkholderia sp. WSM4177]MBB5482201.1 hypothetical protein [Paraburkholderia sp. WSM4180]
MKHSDYPALYQSASDLSQRSQTSFLQTFLGHMGLLTVAALISVVNSSRPEMDILQAMVLLGALGCAIYLYFGRPDRHWYSGRAVAESVKTLVWRFVSKAEPFDHADELDRHDFVLRLKAVIEQNKDVAGLLTTHLDGVQISPEMEQLRQQNLADRVNYYLNSRIVDQQSWYANKAAFNRRMVKRFFALLIVVIVTAIFFSIAKIEFPTAQFWPTDFFVTLAAGVLSWIQAKKFQELAISYALTAHEISLIRQQVSEITSDDHLSKFVGDAENAFSREHTQWIARKDT